MELSRREFLKYGGVSVSNACLLCAGCRPTFLTQLLGSAGTDKRPVGPVVWKRSTCLQCPAGCGIQVRTVSGNAVKIEGNPDHPLNRGRLCPKGQAGLQVLYDPDRLQGPLKRSGKRGSGDWTRISWEEAIDEVSARLSQIRREQGPHTVVVMSGGPRGRMPELLHRFAQSYGTPNEIDTRAMGSGNNELAHYLTHGVADYVAYDWEKVNYVISFGASLIETFGPTVMLQRMVANLRRGRPGKRVKLVTVDPRCSVTASKSDEWIPIRPGTDGALALGMAHVLIREKLYDERFVSEQATGFRQWKEAIVDGYTVEAAAVETGIPAEDIVRLAREFSQRGPAIAVAGRGAGMHTNGLYNLMAVHSLNALVGNIGRPGGVMVQDKPVFAPWPETTLDDVARRGLEMPRLDGAGTARFPLAESVSAALPDAIISDRPYKTSAVLVYYANPLFSHPNPGRFREAFDKTPLVVSFSPFMDETTAVADLVLPDHTYLERWQDDVPPPSVGYPVLSLGQPVVEPLYDTMDTGDALIRTAKAMGGGMAATFPWGNHQEAIRAALKGTAASVSMDEDKFWKEIVEKGVWSNGPYEFGRRERVFRTPSGKFEFISTLMEGKLAAVATKARISVDELTAQLGLEARGEKVFMPHYEKPRFLKAKGPSPLHFNSYKTMMHAEGGGANQPWLHESYGVQLGESWGPWIEINPSTAAAYGIRDGDMVEVESATGKIVAKARWFEGAMPDVINMPYEYGHTEGGRWVGSGGGNPNTVVGVLYDGLSGTVSRSATLVTVRKV